MNWVIRQLREAMPFGLQPKYLFRDNDGIYGSGVRAFLESCGITEVRTAYGSPWQNPFVERYIGTLPREMLDQTTTDFRAKQTHFCSCTRRFASQICPRSCIDYPRSLYTRLNNACRFPSLFCRKALANPFGGIGMVSKSESSLVLASTSHQDRVFRRDTYRRAGCIGENSLCRAWERIPGGDHRGR